MQMRLTLQLAFASFAAVAAHAENIVIVEDVGACRLVEIHRPAPDVAYQPGVDVHGRPVAPADLAGSPAVVLPQDIPIDLGIPLSAFLGTETPPFLDEAEVDVGRVTVDIRTGALHYNGQRLDSPYAVICEEEAAAD